VLPVRTISGTPASQLLSETKLSVGQVATILGYSDVAYFSRQYKRYAGHSPGRRS
jgi:YesN/AraC family two-component response regulator